ncbi:MAG: DNA polymerase III subunit delta [Candidatus Competibacteraceae bacterium]
MKLRLEQLGGQLVGQLAPIYFVYGDEPLLVQEALAAIRSAARAGGYSERVCLTVEPGFDWNRFWESAVSPSLFAERRLLELYLGGAKLDDAGGKMLQAYAKRPAADAVLLLSAGKLEAGAQKSAWFSALETAGTVVPVWPIEASQLPAWIEQRMRAQGLRPTPEAVTLLAERVEGNLLAASQEIARLQLLFGGGTLSAEQLLAVVGDSARYSVYDLVDAALAGQAERVVRIVYGLRDEGVEPVLVCWALHREIRLLSLLAFATVQGQALEGEMARNKVWEKHKPLLRRALQRLPVRTCRRLLDRCAHLDRSIKGAATGNPWDEILSLGLSLAGREAFTIPVMLSQE